MNILLLGPDITGNILYATLVPREVVPLLTVLSTIQIGALKVPIPAPKFTLSVSSFCAPTL